MSAIPTQQWVFRARVERVVDGDTVDLTIDCGMHGRRVERLRLLRVDTPETRGVPDRAPGLAAKAFTEAWLLAAAWPGATDYPLTIRTVKTDSFGRYLCEIWRDDGANLSDDLLAAGHAVPYGG